MAGDPHGPNRFADYIETHDTVMGQFVDRGFILEDGIEITPMGNGVILMKGMVTCLGDIRLDVTKSLKILDGEGANALVQTCDYSYNASLPIGNILRYDYPHPDHSRFHHVHRFNVFDGDHIGNIDACEWPTLGAVVGELEVWYYENYSRLYPSEPL